jgi:hypothetical protein
VKIAADDHCAGLVGGVRLGFGVMVGHINASEL